MTPAARLYYFFVSLLFGSLLASLANLAWAEPIVTESTSTVTTNGSQTTKVESPPPSAIAPQFSAGNNSDLCTIGAGGAVQTQILGISIGGTYTEEHCQMLKASAALMRANMKVAAVSVLCQDPKIFAAMEAAGTPCPHRGRIADEAQAYWDANPDDRPWLKKSDVIGDEDGETAQDKRNKALAILGGIFGTAILF